MPSKRKSSGIARSKPMPQSVDCVTKIAGDGVVLRAVPGLHTFTLLFGTFVPSPAFRDALLFHFHSLFFRISASVAYMQQVELKYTHPLYLVMFPIKITVAESELYRREHWDHSSCKLKERVP